MLSPTQSRWLAWGWALFVLAIMSIPGNRIPTVPEINLDKLVHLTVFGLLFLLFAKAGYRPWLVALCCIAFGIATEVWQHYVAIGRFGDTYDAIADTLGVLLAWAGWEWLQRRVARQPQQR